MCIGVIFFQMIYTHQSYMEMMIQVVVPKTIHLCQHFRWAIMLVNVYFMSFIGLEE